MVKVNSVQLPSACALLKFHCGFSSPGKRLPASCINPAILAFISPYKLLGWLAWPKRKSPTKQSNTFITLSSRSMAPVQCNYWPWQPILQKGLLSSWSCHPWHECVKAKADFSSCVFFPISRKSFAGSQKKQQSCQALMSNNKCQAEVWSVCVHLQACLRSGCSMQSKHPTETCRCRTIPESSWTLLITSS